MKQLTELDVFSKLRPRAPQSHKGDYGRLSLVCGSRAYRGAATLSASAALRSGVGIARLCSIEPVIAACAAHLPAVTYLPLTEGANGTIGRDGAMTICTNLRANDVCLVGCGLGNTPDTADLVERLLLYAPCRLVLDADALNGLAGRTQLLRQAKEVPILTPHLGEFARVFGTTVGEIADNDAELALGFAREHRCIVVLKSHTTYIAAPTGEIVKSTTGNAGLAKGGSGDLLAGLIGGFAAQGQDSFSAACIGVYLAGAAADLCAARKGMYAMLPGEQLDDLSTLFLQHGL